MSGNKQRLLVLRLLFLSVGEVAEDGEGLLVAEFCCIGKPSERDAWVGGHTNSLCEAERHEESGIRRALHGGIAYIGDGSGRVFRCDFQVVFSQADLGVGVTGLCRNGVPLAGEGRIRLCTQGMGIAGTESSGGAYVPLVCGSLQPDDCLFFILWGFVPGEQAVAVLVAGCGISLGCTGGQLRCVVHAAGAEQQKWEQGGEVAEFHLK